MQCVLLISRQGKYLVIRVLRKGGLLDGNTTNGIFQQLQQFIPAIEYITAVNPASFERHSLASRGSESDFLCLDHRQLAWQQAFRVESYPGKFRSIVPGFPSHIGPIGIAAGGGRITGQCG